MTRILHILRAPVGGLFRHVRDLSAEQARRGARVGVICDERASDTLTGERLSALEQHLSLGLYRVPMSRQVGWEDAQAFKRTRDIAAALRADVLHGHGAKGGAYARLAARALKRSGRAIACFYTPHGGSLHYHPASLEGRVYMGLERAFAPATDGLIFESEYSSRLYAERIGRNGPEARVVPNGLLPEEFRERVLVADAADFLFLGELRHLKGVDVLLRALKRVNDGRARSARAVIVGDGPDAGIFKSQAQDLGLGAHVSFPGAMPAAEAFTLARALVMPSRAESFPYVVLEAGAAGIPMLATDVGGIPEIVAGTDTGLLPAGDEATLAIAMQSLLDDPDTAHQRAWRLRSAISGRFTVRQMTEAITAFYSGKIAEKQLPRLAS